MFIHEENGLSMGEKAILKGYCSINLIITFTDVNIEISKTETLADAIENTCKFVMYIRFNYDILLT